MTIQISVYRADKHQFVALFQIAANSVILSVVEQIRKKLRSEVEGSVPKNTAREQILRLRMALPCSAQNDTICYLHDKHQFAFPLFPHHYRNIPIYIV